MLKIVIFIQSTWQELRHKVSWPTQEELQRMVVLLIIGTSICAVLIGSINIFLKRIMDWVYSKF